MDWLNKYKEDLTWVFHEAEQRIATFPEPLNRLGSAYLDKFHVFKKNSSKNYVCYLLPLWLEDQTQIPREQSRDFSLANVFVMLHYFIQDDLMDEPHNNGQEQLPLGNLFYLEFLRIYRRYFSADHSFWIYFERYTREWAEGVTNEKEQDYFAIHPIRIAQKASPVKLASTGALLLAGRESLISESEELVARLLMTLQMSDDWADWQEDLAEGNYNSLLSFIRSRNGLSADEPLTEAAVRKAVYDFSCLGDYVQHTEVNHQLMQELAFRASDLISFHEVLKNNLAHEAAAIQNKRKSLAMGGFSYWLANRQDNAAQGME